MKPAKHQLSIAEAAAHGAALQVTPEGLFLRGLYYRTPDDMENWQAIAAYNTFIRAHEELYCHVRTASGILSVHASGYSRFHGAGYPQRLELLRELASRRVLFDVAFTEDLTEELIGRYRMALLADLWVMDERLLETLRGFTESGGLCIATGLTGWYDAQYRKRRTNPIARLHGIRWMEEPSRRTQNPAALSGRTNIMDRYDAGPEEDLAEACVEALAKALDEAVPPPLRVSGHPSVLFNITEDARGRLLVHLLNYGDRPIPLMTVSAGKGAGLESAEWFSPDAGSGTVTLADDGCARVEELQLYGLLRVTIRA